MGTFHDDRGELHGMTVVAELAGGELCVGRYDQIRQGRLILRDADVHPSGGDAAGREAYLRRAAEVGVWKRHDRLALPVESVVAVRRLGDLAR